MERLAAEGLGGALGQACAPPAAARGAAAAGAPRHPPRPAHVLPGSSRGGWGAEREPAAAACRRRRRRRLLTALAPPTLKGVPRRMCPTLCFQVRSLILHALNAGCLAPPPRAAGLLHRHPGADLDRPRRGRPLPAVGRTRRRVRLCLRGDHHLLPADAAAHAGHGEEGGVPPKGAGQAGAGRARGEQARRQAQPGAVCLGPWEPARLAEARRLLPPAPPRSAGRRS